MQSERQYFQSASASLATADRRQREPLADATLRTPDVSNGTKPCSAEHSGLNVQVGEFVLLEDVGQVPTVVMQVSNQFDDKRLTFMELLLGRPLRLGIHRLPVVERVVIQTTVRLSSNQGGCRWKLVQEPPYDALLVDENALGSLDDTLRATSLIVTLTHRASDQPNSLQRPIRAEKLQLLLRRLQQTVYEASKRRRLPRRRPADPGSARFMLRRWPANRLIGDDPDRLLLASLLRHHTLSASELATLSKQPVSCCIEFLHLLQKAGALNVHPVTNADIKSKPAPDSKPVRGSRLRRVANWFNGIRQRRK